MKRSGVRRKGRTPDGVLADVSQGISEAEAVYRWREETQRIWTRGEAGDACHPFDKLRTSQSRGGPQRLSSDRRRTADLPPAQCQGVHDGLEQDDDVQPEGLVLDVVEVVLEFEEGVWGISDFELRIANCEFSNPKSQIVESGFVVVEHEELAGGEGEDLAAELGATRYRLSPSTFTSTGSVQG
jgi:hypothetical protein